MMLSGNSVRIVCWSYDGFKDPLKPTTLLGNGAQDYIYTREGNTGETNQEQADKHARWTSGSETRGKKMITK